ncbi:response regulator [Flavobacteriaceae bacterium Ap0902]|nr:response regulator [Flavobacteriaceae bacterium Ap0902]
MIYQNKGFSYAIIEDIEDAIDGIVNRMNCYQDWFNISNSTNIENAIKIIENDKPDLIFMDWNIKGGSTYEILDLIGNNADYCPFIIYFTGFQKDQPDIPEKVFNKYHVDIYLIKPIWKKLSNNLENYLELAKRKAKDSLMLNIEDIHRNLHLINPKDIISIAIYDSKKRTKSVRLLDGSVLIIKQTFDKIEELLSSSNIDYKYTNKRYSLVTKDHICRIENEYVVFKNNSPKVEISKDNLKEIKDWLLSSIS